MESESTQRQINHQQEMAMTNYRQTLMTSHSPPQEPQRMISQRINPVANVNFVPPSERTVPAPSISILPMSTVGRGSTIEMVSPPKRQISFNIMSPNINRASSPAPAMTINNRATINQFPSRVASPPSVLPPPQPQINIRASSPQRESTFGRPIANNINYENTQKFYQT